MPSAVINGMYVSAQAFALCIHSDTPDRLTVAALLTSAFICASGIKNGPLILPLRLIQIIRNAIYPFIKIATLGAAVPPGFFEYLACQGVLVGTIVFETDHVHLSPVSAKNYTTRGIILRVYAKTDEVVGSGIQGPCC